LLTHDLFEGRRKKLTILNVAFELVTLVVMGVIIGWLHP
jgi:F0F1-type ATP synthase assembly protein I